MWVLKIVTFQQNSKTSSPSERAVHPAILILVPYLSLVNRPIPFAPSLFSSLFSLELSLRTILPGRGRWRENRRFTFLPHLVRAESELAFAVGVVADHIGLKVFTANVALVFADFYGYVTAADGMGPLLGKPDRLGCC